MTWSWQRTRRWTGENLPPPLSPLSHPPPPVGRYLPVRYSLLKGWWIIRYASPIVMPITYETETEIRYAVEKLRQNRSPKSETIFERLPVSSSPASLPFHCPLPLRSGLYPKYDDSSPGSPPDRNACFIGHKKTWIQIRSPDPNSPKAWTRISLLFWLPHHFLLQKLKAHRNVFTSVLWSNVHGSTVTHVSYFNYHRRRK